MGVKGVHVLSIPLPVVQYEDCIAVIVDPVAGIWPWSSEYDCTAAGGKDRRAFLVRKIHPMMNSIISEPQRHWDISVRVYLQFVISTIRGQGTSKPVMIIGMKSVRNDDRRRSPFDSRFWPQLRWANILGLVWSYSGWIRGRDRGAS
jgi:hypothetical protein